MLFIVGYAVERGLVGAQLLVRIPFHVKDGRRREYLASAHALEPFHRSIIRQRDLSRCDSQRAAFFTSASLGSTSVRLNSPSVAEYARSSADPFLSRAFHSFSEATSSSSSTRSLVRLARVEIFKRCCRTAPTIHSALSRKR